MVHEGPMVHMRPLQQVELYRLQTFCTWINARARWNVRHDCWDGFRSQGKIPFQVAHGVVQVADILLVGMHTGSFKWESMLICEVNDGDCW